MFVTPCFPRADLAAQPIDIVEAAIEALTIQNADFDFRHVEPTGVLGCVMELQVGKNGVGVGFSCYRSKGGALAIGTADIALGIYEASQSSICKPSTRWNSRVLCVTKVT